jgi:hypothetical protein
MLLSRAPSIYAGPASVGGFRFAWARYRILAQFLLGPDPILQVPSVLPAALHIELMSSASDLFFGFVLAFDHDDNLFRS